MSLQRIVEYFIKRPLSGKEIQRLTGSYPIYYSDLGKYKTLEERQPANLMQLYSIKHLAKATDISIV